MQQQIAPASASTRRQLLIQGVVNFRVPSQDGDEAITANEPADDPGSRMAQEKAE